MARRSSGARRASFPSPPAGGRPAVSAWRNKLIDALTDFAARIDREGGLASRIAALRADQSNLPAPRAGAGDGLIRFVDGAIYVQFGGVWHQFLDSDEIKTWVGDLFTLKAYAALAASGGALGGAPGAMPGTWTDVSWLDTDDVPAENVPTTLASGRFRPSQDMVLYAHATLAFEHDSSASARSFSLRFYDQDDTTVVLNSTVSVPIARNTTDTYVTVAMVCDALNNPHAGNDLSLQIKDNVGAIGSLVWKNTRLMLHGVSGFANPGPPPAP